MLRTYDNALKVMRDPIYSSNQPPNPYGFNFFGINRTGNPREHIQPPFGIPLISAVYDFGLARPPVTETSDVAQAAAAAIEGTPVIGRVSVSGGDYDITLAGLETLDGSPVYHLKLNPRREPDQNRLREVWVDAQSYDVRKLVSNGIFPSGPASAVPWTVTFLHLHGGWLMRTESTSSSITRHGGLFGGTITYAGITYTLGGYEYPGLISDLEFSEEPVQTDAIQM